MELFLHQQKYAKGYKDKELVVHEGGTGKTVCASVWLTDGRDNDALVICPKRVVIKWQKELKLWGAKATVLSKEQFKKIPIKKWSAIVVDEADEFASPLFTKNRSQLSDSLYNLIKTYNMPTLLLTATPIRSNPWNLHTLLCFVHIYIDWKKWREKFFTLEKRPFMPRMAWFPKSDWREQIRPILEKYSDIILLKDCVKDLPPEITGIIKIPNEPFENNPEWEAKASFVAEHKHEQKNKLKYIQEIGKEYRKVLVVAYYVEQVEELGKQLSKERQTFIIHGSIKEQEKLLLEANKVDECYLVVQASLGSGFDADTFSCVIFASMSYSVRDYMQMKYRIRRIKNLHPVIYYHLLVGRCDKAILKNVQNGFDFIPSQWKPSKSPKETET